MQRIGIALLAGGTTLFATNIPLFISNRGVVAKTMSAILIGVGLTMVAFGLYSIMVNKG